jgi:hypothetical protein
MRLIWLPFHLPQELLPVQAQLDGKRNFFPENKQKKYF